MLTTLRNHAQSWFIKVILGLIVLTFVISFGIGTFTATKEVLVRLDGEEILVATFNQQYQDDLERLRRQYPENADEVAQRTNLRRQVYDRMVNRWLLLREARKQGFSIGDAEVQEAIRSQTAFQINNQFDFATYRTVLSQNRFTPERFESMMREDLLLRKYQRGLLVGLSVSELEVDLRYRMEHEQVAVEYVRLGPDRFGQGLAVTEEEARAFHEEHSAEYQEPARYRLRYLALGLSQLAGQVSLPERAAKRYYERHRQEEFSTPTRIRASHILKRIDPEATEAQRAETRAALQAVLEEARGGADFAELARQHSEDLTAAKGGDLGLFAKGDMVAAFEEAAFALEPGEISDIVVSPFGLHLIRVSERVEGESKPFEAVEDEILENLREERAARKLELEAERLPQRMQRDGIEAVAQELGVEVQETDWFTGSSELPGLGDVSGLYAQVGTLEVGDTGTWRRNPVLGHVFFQIAEHQPAKPRPYDEVAGEIRARLLAEKRQQAAAEAGNQAMAGFAQAADFAGFVREHGLPLKTLTVSPGTTSLPDIGFNPDFYRVAFALTADAPFGASTFQGQTYLLRLVSRQLPAVADAETQREALRQRMKTEWEQYFLQKETDRLKAATEIELVAPEFVAGL